MPDLISLEQLAASLWTCWEEEFPLAVPTLFPALKVNTANLDEWIELVPETAEEPPQRRGNPVLLEFHFSVHLFVKQSSDKGRAQQLADAVRQTLARATLPIRDYDESGTPAVGWLRLGEPAIRDLSRNHLNTSQHPLQHLVLSFHSLGQRLV